MGRNILLITTDQQRFDSIGCNGGTVARTPNVDALATNGIRFDRCHPQSVVCMPSRATIMTGQHISTHGVWMNGVPLPEDSPSVASVLNDAGYKTSLFGKAHFEPFMDPFFRFEENRLAHEERTGPHRGFEHVELATHGALGFTHYSRWIQQHHGEHVFSYFPVVDLTLEVSTARGGDTDAPQMWRNPIPRDLYHTEWVADRSIDWLSGLSDSDDWFCWVSFPDPHHPWDPPEAEMSRVDWRDLDLPPGWIDDPSHLDRVFASKPRQWDLWRQGQLVSNYEAPPQWIPSTLTADQVREVNARVHVENELIDEAVGRILAILTARGWDADTDIFFTTDHGEFQGDHNLLFKGPFHIDSLMRLPFVWRPAPSSGQLPAEVHRPVGLLDLAPTFCSIAGLEIPDWMEGRPLPTSDVDADERGFERVLTEWDSTHPNGTWMHLRTIYRDSMVATAYLPGTVHDGTEGELYDLDEDPLQQVNLWDDPSKRSIRDDLVADLFESLPERVGPLPLVEAPV